MQKAICTHASRANRGGHALGERYANFQRLSPTSKLAFLREEPRPVWSRAT